jgi:hypothetical protein
MTNIINFPVKKPQVRELRSMTDLCPVAPGVDERAKELLAEARHAVSVHSPEAVASLLSYAAAMLEQTGFQMFPSQRRTARTDGKAAI